MTRPTRSTLRQGQTLYVLVNALLTPSGHHEVRPVHLDSNAQRERIARQLGPGSVISYSRRQVESVAKALNARLVADLYRPLVSALAQRPFTALRASRSPAYVA